MPLKSAFRVAEEAHGDDELLSMLRASAAARSHSRSAECERATTGAARCGKPLGQDGRQGLPEKRPSSSSVAKVLTVQHRNVCAQVGDDNRLSFSDIWSFGADDQGRSVAVASAALSGFGEAEGHLRVRRLRRWKSQLQLIEGCYSGQTGVVSKVLTVGASDEISPLFTFLIPHHPHVSSWPLRALLEALLEAGAVRVAVAQLKDALSESEIAQRVGMSLCRRFIILSFFFVHCKRDLWNAFSAKSPDGRSVWRHATRDGELRQTGSECHGGFVMGA